MTDFTDARRLQDDAYRDSAKLTDRQSIYRYRPAGPDFHDRVVELVDWSGVRRLADVGCGNSVYIDRVLDRLAPSATVVAVDLSVGMLQTVTHTTGRIAADVQRLPVATSALDALMAMHMLYHLPDIAAGVRELRRVVRPGGQVIVATNGDRHLQELAHLMARPVRSTTRFGLDAAEDLLGETFESVERHDMDTVLEVPDPGAVAAYLRSTVSLGADPDKIERGVAEAEKVIAAEGVLRITVHPGVLVCR